MRINYSTLGQEAVHNLLNQTATHVVIPEVPNLHWLAALLLHNRKCPESLVTKLESSRPFWHPLKTLCDCECIFSLSSMVGLQVIFNELRNTNICRLRTTRTG